MRYFDPDVQRSNASVSLPVSRSLRRSASRWQRTALMSLVVLVALLGSACGAERASVSPKASAGPTANRSQTELSLPNASPPGDALQFLSQYVT